LGIPVFALTGTNGKTTTKELVYAVLKKTFEVIATAGNLNNHIGVPLTILRADDNTGILVLEMGDNHVGEIAHLCSIADPTHGLVTNVGRAHLEGFGSFEGVVKAKSELLHYLKRISRPSYLVYLTETAQSEFGNRTDGRLPKHIYATPTNKRRDIFHSCSDGSASWRISQPARSSRW